MAAIHGDAEKQRHSLAYGQDEGHCQRRHTPSEPIDANDAQQLCHRVREEVQEHARQHERGAVQRLGEASVRERDGQERDARTGAQPGKFGGDVVPGEIKEGEGESVEVEHVFLPGRLSEGVGCGVCLGGLDVSRKDVILGESEESREEERKAEDGYALCVEGDGDVGWLCTREIKFGFRSGEGGKDDPDRDYEYGNDLFEGISRDTTAESLRSGGRARGRTVYVRGASRGAC